MTEAKEPRLSDAQRADLVDLLAMRYDSEKGGWGFSHKYLDWDAVEQCLLRAREGDAKAEAMARETLAKQIKLIDPVWGGVNQYSDSGDWEHPHFENVAALDYPFGGAVQAVAEGLLELAGRVYGRLIQHHSPQVRSARPRCGPPSISSSMLASQRHSWVAP